MKKMVAQVGRYSLVVLACLMLLVSSCKTDNASSTKQNRVEKPNEPQVAVAEFDEVAAYNYVQKQVDFGPRVPNTPEHDSCAVWLTETLKKFADKVQVQEAQVTAFNGTILNSKNIIASFNPKNNNRLLFCAHWDTRPFADMEEDPELAAKPILGADDAGSGVGVLLEIANHLSKNKPNIGIDIIFFDTEDYGPPANYESHSNKNYWCLGSQYWAKNQHRPNYKPIHAVLLDIVGGKDAVFTQEGYSMQYAPNTVKKVWDTGNKLGYGKYFKYKRTSGIIDDHVSLIEVGIPCIDIIRYEAPPTNRFGAHWHTHDDNMDIISKETLDAVGTTVLNFIYLVDKGIL